MTVRELIEKLNKIENKDKDVCISLSSGFGDEYDLFAETFRIVKDEYIITLTDLDCLLTQSKFSW